MFDFLIKLLRKKSSNVFAQKSGKKLKILFLVAVFCYHFLDMKTVFKFLATSATLLLLLSVFSMDSVSANKWEETNTALEQMCEGRAKDVCRQNSECRWGLEVDDGESTDDVERCLLKDSCVSDDGVNARSMVSCMTVSGRCKWYVPDFLSKKEGSDFGSGANLVKTQLNDLLEGMDESKSYKIPSKWFVTGANASGGMCLTKMAAGIRQCVDAAWYDLMWSPVKLDKGLPSRAKSKPGSADGRFYFKFTSSVEECFSAVDSEFQLDAYAGPVFDGPGLFGGAELARRQLDNGISKETDLKRLVVQWTRFVLPIAAVIAVIAIIWAGILWITDFGDGARAEQGKKILMWTIGGILLILASYAIVSTIMRVGGKDSAVVKTDCFPGCFWDGGACKAKVRNEVKNICADLLGNPTDEVVEMTDKRCGQKNVPMVGCFCSDNSYFKACPIESLDDPPIVDYSR